MTNMQIESVLHSLHRRDRLRINDWDGVYQVCGVSEHYVLVYCPESWKYSILHLNPFPYTYNGIPAGSMVCSMDDRIFGYIDGYHFDDFNWVSQYMDDLESGKIGTSVKRREELLNIEVIT